MQQETLGHKCLSFFTSSINFFQHQVGCKRKSFSQICVIFPFPFSTCEVIDTTQLDAILTYKLSAQSDVVRTSFETLRLLHMQDYKFVW